MFDIKKIARKHILDIKPYSSARDEYEGDTGIFLDANENSLGSALQSGNHNRYPDPLQRKVKTLLSEVKNVPANQIFLGNGSDEPIDLLVRAFCEPHQDAILQMPPTYGMYQVSADINAVEVINVNLTLDFEIDTEKVLANLKSNTKIVFICSPNNPTGNLVSTESIVTILNNFNGLVVVDEAYIDFTDKASATTLLCNYPQLVVLQTFSKAWGLANLRLGIAYASVEIIALLNKIKPPYNINGVSQALAIEALHNVELKNRFVKEIIAEREKLAIEIANISYVEKVYPSDANFLLVKTKDGNFVYNELVKNQIITRNRSKVILCENAVRISIGTKDENIALFKALNEIKL